MTGTPTPGQVAYAAYVLSLRPTALLPLDAMWARLRPEEHAAWEAAAQAVLPPFRFALGQRVRWAESVQMYRVEGRSYEERLYAAPVILYRLLLENAEDYLTEDALEAHLSPWEDTP